MTTSGANHNAKETAEAFVLANLREEDIKNATALSSIMQYPALPGPHLVWGYASQKDGCWIYCKTCGAWVGTASHDVGIDPDGKCVHYTETVKTRLRVTMNAATDMVIGPVFPPRFGPVFPPRFFSTIKYLSGDKEPVRRMMDH